MHMRRRKSKSSYGFKKSVRKQKRKSKKYNSFRISRGGIRL